MGVFLLYIIIHTQDTQHNHLKHTQMETSKECYPVLKQGSPPMAAVREQPWHAELTKMDLLLKERGWARSEFCQTWGKGSRCRTGLMQIKRKT